MLHELDANKKHSQLELLNAADPVCYGLETFPNKISSFSGLFSEHGREVRGESFDLDFGRYRQIEKEGRLVWVVARSKNNGIPVGYACSFWYRDLHFVDRVAADDLWFVHKDFRGKGVGKTVKLMCHEELKKQGVVSISDTIRSSGFVHPTLMRDLGFEPWGIKWVKLGVGAKG